MRLTGWCWGPISWVTYPKQSPSSGVEVVLVIQILKKPRSIWMSVGKILKSRKKTEKWSKQWHGTGNIVMKWGTIVVWFNTKTRFDDCSFVVIWTKRAVNSFLFIYLFFSILCYTLFNESNHNITSGHFDGQKVKTNSVIIKNCL